MYIRARSVNQAENIYPFIIFALRGLHRLFIQVDVRRKRMAIIFSGRFCYCLRKKFSGEFERENDDPRVIFFNVSKLELIALDVLNIFGYYD
ncbi:hypothetical protein L484_015330 [Morus notabilis]|uniref:Uncharacterized protein n=1 Tax=Morus notabilis TaxID=981085 RepID=W9RK80_9ROSA|nr:hypothetical protein L484_015330 [Morus notabilis]